MSCNEYHDRYVATGRCDAVHWSKAWCNKPAGHSGPHYAPHYTEPGKPRGEPLFW